MLFHEFIPCIHLVSLRRNQKKDDTLEEGVESNILMNSLSCEEEYRLILCFKTKDEFRTIKDKPHRGIFVEMIAGSISLTYLDKIKIVTLFINGAFTEQEEFDFIDISIEEKESFFKIYQKRVGGKKDN